MIASASRHCLTDWSQSLSRYSMMPTSDIDAGDRQRTPCARSGRKLKQASMPVALTGASVDGGQFRTVAARGLSQLYMAILREAQHDRCLTVYLKGRCWF